MANFLYTLVIYPLHTIIECIYTLFNRLIDSPGACVIGVSAGVSLLCLPLYAVAEKWQEIERGKQLSMKPVLDHIKATFTGDERYMMTAAYYRECRYSQIMSLRSSFGLLIQIPFFIAAYQFLSHLPALNGASFLLIRDMGRPDAMFSVGSFSVNVLPIAMTVINCVSGLIYSKGHGIREKIQIFGMAAVFLVVLYGSPSGLVLYWTFNNIFSLVKNVFYKFRNPAKAFWIFCCAAIIPLSIPLLFFTTTKWKYKVVFLAAVGLLFALPLVLRGIGRLLDTRLSALASRGGARTALYLSSCAATFLLLGLAIPTTLISSSTADFAKSCGDVDPLSYVLAAAAQSAGFFLFWAPCVYFLFGRRVQTVLAVLASSSSACLTMNTFAFRLQYGDISPSLVFLNPPSDFGTMSAVSAANAAACALVLALTVLAAGRRRVPLASVQAVLSLTFVASSALNVGEIRKSYGEFLASGGMGSASEVKPIFHLSKSAPNVVLFMLDRAEGEYVHDIFEESPELRGTYSGFTHYNNCLSFNSHTFQASPALFGGYEYTPLEMNRRRSEELREKHNESLLLLPRIFTEEGNFTATVTDPSWANYSDYMDLSIFGPYPKIEAHQTQGRYNSLWRAAHGGGGAATSDALVRRNLLFFSFFRSAPIVLRELIYKKGTWWSADDSTKGFEDFINWYAALDFLPELTEISEREGGSYVCMVNEASHENVLLQAPDYVPAANVTNPGTSMYRDDPSYHTTAAAIKRIASWIEALKAGGAYDNTRIILVSDHGTGGGDAQMERDDALDEAVFGGIDRGRGRFHCLLMVKDFGADGGMVEDGTTFMTNADVPSIALRGLFESPVNPFTGRPVPLDTEGIKRGGVYISANDRHVPVNHGKYTFSIADDEWWLVKDDIFRAGNWRNENPFGE